MRERGEERTYSNTTLLNVEAEAAGWLARQSSSHCLSASVLVEN